MMTLRDQVKLYHWQTFSYPRHKATDELVEQLDSNIDRFVEVYIGKYGRPKLTSSTSTIRLRNHSDKEASTLLKDAINWLMKLKLKTTDTDLYNIRDEIIADLNKTLYLFTLK